MDHKFISREKIILQLMEMDAELDQLEKSIQSSMQEFKKEWLDEQENQLEQCEARLSAVEQFIESKSITKKEVVYPVKIEYGISM